MNYLIAQSESGEVLVFWQRGVSMKPVLVFSSLDAFRQWLLDSLEWISLYENEHLFSGDVPIPDYLLKAFEND